MTGTADSEPLKVLYLAGVGAFGGASRSLLEVVRGIEVGAVAPYFVTTRGEVVDYYGNIAQDLIVARGIARFDHTRASHYRGTRWVVVLREMAYIPFSLWALVRARHRWPQIDLIHVNEFTGIVVGLAARWLFKAPLIVHVRALVETDARLARTRWLQKQLRKVDAVVAIDENVRATLPPDLPVKIIHNSFDAVSDGPPDASYLAQLDRLRQTSLKVGFVGRLLRMKGVVELLQAARLLKDAGEDIQFLLVGDNGSPEGGLVRWTLERLQLAHSVGKDLRETVSAYGLDDDVLFLGPTHDIQRVLPHIDVLAFPTFLDSPGRPVFEAAHFGAPSIVATRAPRRDTLVHLETGIAIDRPDPQLIANAILHFSRDRREVKRMGENARVLAQQNFETRANAAQLLALYQQVAGRCASLHARVGSCTRSS